MSGTSVDAIDAVLLQKSIDEMQLISAFSQPFPEDIKEQIIDLFEPGSNEIERLGTLDRQLGYLYSKCVHQLLSQSNIKPHEITAIGCHGQTIRHRPRNKLPFTIQIGDAHTLAIETNIPVVHQFRQADIALEGQGAPLTPLFHKAWFGNEDEDRCIVNIGGIANITALPRSGGISGWDTGPGNGLMDAWIKQHRNKKYDHAGGWAARGSVIEPLLNNLLDAPYFALKAPKSTGKEEFTLAWLSQFEVDQFAATDVQRTLLELTVETISRDILSSEPIPSTAYICGGGAFNSLLLTNLTKRLAPIKVKTTEALGLSPSWVEASAFAWFADQFWHKRPSRIKGVTGATRNSILGQLAMP